MKYKGCAPHLRERQKPGGQPRVLNPIRGKWSIKVEKKLHYIALPLGQRKLNISTIDPLAPNDVYIRRTAQLTSRRCILNIYSTNILTEYIKHAAILPFFSLQEAVYFIMLSFLVPVIFTF